jgi:hypothetical protein
MGPAAGVLHDRPRRAVRRDRGRRRGCCRASGPARRRSRGRPGFARGAVTRAAAAGSGRRHRRRSLLLGLARTGNAEHRGLRLVDHDLREPGWIDALALEREPDAFVSTTALHWLTREQLGAVYAACAAALRPGGVLVNGDHLFEGSSRPRLDTLTRIVARRRAARISIPDGEDWTAWWRAVEDAPELADLVAVRGPHGVEHQVDEVPTLHDHVSTLRQAGFAEAGTVWQHGDDRVLVAAASARSRTRVSALP